MSHQQDTGAGENGVIQLGTTVRDAETINQALWGFTNVEALNLQRDDFGSSYRLNVVLANNVGAAVALNCTDVANLKIAKFGGGLNQFMLLRCEDVSARRLDRVRFHFTDLEHNAIGFDCSAANVEQIQ
jgi:hypothetical protein